MTNGALRIVVAGAIALAGCGGDAADVDGGAGADAGELDSGSAEHDGSAPDAGATDAAAASDADVADAPSPPDATTAARVELADFTTYGNCMPIVAPDPILAWWLASVTGASGDAATLTDATLTITGSSTVVQRLTVDMPTIALTGGSGSAEQRKTSADANPPAACGELCGGATARLELTFLIDGAPVTATADGTYSCVY